MAQKRLMQELAALQKEKWLKIDYDESNIFKWKIGLWVVNPDSIWHGAYLQADMKFTNDYPYSPPTLRFTTKNIEHANVYPDGKLCISILHKPGDDEQSGELASERWNVLHGVESVLRSVLLLLDDPEISSPANVDASVLYRDDREKYNEKAREVVKKTLEAVPNGVTMPTEADLVPKAPQKNIEDDADFWNMSDEDDDFGGSDSDMDMDDFEDDDEDDEDMK